jgi:hypothetical protein
MLVIIDVKRVIYSICQCIWFFSLSSKSEWSGNDQEQLWIFTPTKHSLLYQGTLSSSACASSHFQLDHLVSVTKPWKFVTLITLVYTSVWIISVNSCFTFVSSVINLIYLKQLDLLQKVLEHHKLLCLFQQWKGVSVIRTTVMTLD